MFFGNRVDLLPNRARTCRSTSRMFGFRWYAESTIEKAHGWQSGTTDNKRQTIDTRCRSHRKVVSLFARTCFCLYSSLPSFFLFVGCWKFLVGCSVSARICAELGTSCNTGSAVSSATRAASFHAHSCRRTSRAGPLRGGHRPSHRLLSSGRDLSDHAESF